MANIFAKEIEQEKKVMGQRIKVRREYLRFTQQEVADHLDINRVTYTQYEVGKNQIPSANLPRLAKLFRVPVAYFFGEELEYKPDEIVYAPILEELARARYSGGLGEDDPSEIAEFIANKARRQAERQGRA